MTLNELVEESKDRRITWKVVQREGENRLLYVDPYHMMTDDFLEAIRQHKGAIMDIVLQQQVVVNAG